MSFEGRCPHCKQLIQVNAEQIQENMFQCPSCSAVVRICKSPVGCTNFTAGDFCTSCKVKAVGLAVSALTGINLWS